MKQHFISVLSLLLCGGSMLASQPNGASQPQMLINASQQGLMAPVWSPQGDKIAVTTDNYNGILIANADGSNLRQLTDASGAGYKMMWSADGKEILGRTNVVENARVFHEVKVWDIESGNATTLVSKTRDLKGTPTWKSASNIVVADRIGVKSVNTKTLATASSSSNAYELMVNDPVGATAKLPALTAYAKSIVINPAISPDGQKVAFQIPGKGMFVCDIDGNNLISFGKGSNPAWMPDSENLIFTRTTDDGQRFTSSDIYSININSKKEYLLTGNTDLIPRRPSVSPDGQKVVFENAADASIYIVNLKY
ncbi:MAG: PD40 domain-containing protein [Muribaculaceae bacterium]|nr:PD40 domain-containing protein [Muribaculaceae bacterium]